MVLSKRYGISLKTVARGEPMMRGRHCHQSSGATKWRQPIALGEICREIRNARAGWRLMSVHRNVMLGL